MSNYNKLKNTNIVNKTDFEPNADNAVSKEFSLVQTIVKTLVALLIAVPLLFASFLMVFPVPAYKLMQSNNNTLGTAVFAYNAYVQADKNYNKDASLGVSYNINNRLKYLDKSTSAYISLLIGKNKYSVEVLSGIDKLLADKDINAYTVQVDSYAKSHSVKELHPYLVNYLGDLRKEKTRALYISGDIDGASKWALSESFEPYYTASKASSLMYIRDNLVIDYTAAMLVERKLDTIGYRALGSNQYNFGTYRTEVFEDIVNPTSFREVEYENKLYDLCEAMKSLTGGSAASDTARVDDDELLTALVIMRMLIRSSDNVYNVYRCFRQSSLWQSSLRPQWEEGNNAWQILNGALRDRYNELMKRYKKL